MSRASLVETYIAALPLTAVTIVSSGRRCRITEGEPAEGEKIKHRFYFKPSRAELVLMTIGQEGLSGKPPAALAALIERTAATFGAKYQTTGELREAAEIQVAEVRARVAGMESKRRPETGQRTIQEISAGADGEGRAGGAIQQIHRALHGDDGPRRGYQRADDLGAGRSAAGEFGHGRHQSATRADRLFWVVGQGYWLEPARHRRMLKNA